jgi:co-chaperonin GroES (HSP10)
MISPAGCKILVKTFSLAEHDEVYKSAKKAGIELPEFSERKEEINIDKGIVLAMGPSVSDEYVKGLQVGDVIGFARFGGKFITDPTDSKRYLILNDEDVICTFKD